MVDAALNDISGSCKWLDDSSGLLCGFVPAGRTSAPAAPKAPSGPNIQENFGRPTPVRTYQDLLTSAYDEDLFEYYFTNQLAFVNAADGVRTPVGKRGSRPDVQPVAQRPVHPRRAREAPFSRLLLWGFTDVEVWSRTGEKVRTIADAPAVTSCPSHTALIMVASAQPAAVQKRLTRGHQEQGSHRDRVMSVTALFTAAPTEVAKTIPHAGAS
jgi:hypothetical protein